MSTTTTSPTPEAVREQVTRLLAQWRAEAAFFSSSTERNAHPAYQEIISLGQAALPHLLRDLEQTYDGHLSKALAAITGARPVPPEARGRIRQVAEVWLRGARDNGLRA